jgi:ATP synthase protein I
MKASDPVFPDRNEAQKTSDLAWRSVSSLIAGILLYGGLGWLIGKYLGHQDLFMALGVLLGIFLALYLTYVRVSRLDQDVNTNLNGSED